MATKTVSKEELKSLYEKDFVLWVEKNLRLLKEKQFDEVDWENLLEEIEDMGRRHLESVISFMAVILEHLYKYENFKENETICNGWIRSIINSRAKLEKLFIEIPSLKYKAPNELETAWKYAVADLISWFKYPENKHLAKKIFWQRTNG
jgi:hypothetical protein